MREQIRRILWKEVYKNDTSGPVGADIVGMLSAPAVIGELPNTIESEFWRGIDLRKLQVQASPADPANRSTRKDQNVLRNHSQTTGLEQTL